MMWIFLPHTYSSFPAYALKLDLCDFQMAALHHGLLHLREVEAFLCCCYFTPSQICAEYVTHFIKTPPLSNVWDF